MELSHTALLQTFLEESQENLSTLEEALVGLEADPNEVDRLQTIFRMAHTLKGNASIVGLDDVADLTHQMEDVLARVRTGALPVTRDLVTLLLQAVDAVRELVPASVEEAQG